MDTGHFHLLLDIMNTAAMNIDVQVSELLFSFPLGLYLEVQLLDHMVILCLSF